MGEKWSESDKQDFHDKLREGIDKGCREYVDSGKPQKTEADKSNYDLCCVHNAYCSIFVQPWFWITVGAVVLAIIVLCVVLCVCCCCCKGRLCGGADQMKGASEEASKEEDLSEDSSESSSSSDSE